MPDETFFVETVVVRLPPSLVEEGEEEMEYVGVGVLDVSAMETEEEVATKFVRW